MPPLGSKRRRSCLPIARSACRALKSVRSLTATTISPSTIALPSPAEGVGRRDAGETLGPIQALPGEDLGAGVRDAQLAAVAVELDLVDPAATSRRLRLQRRELRGDEPGIGPRGHYSLDGRQVRDPATLTPPIVREIGAQVPEIESFLATCRSVPAIIGCRSRRAMLHTNKPVMPVINGILELREGYRRPLGGRTSASSTLAARSMVSGGCAVSAS